MVKIESIILCAGYATRLYPLTENQPKPLLAVGDRTILDHIMDKVEQLPEVNEVFIVTNDRFKGHFDSWQETRKPKKSTHIISDGTKSNDDRLGAVGDLQFAIETKKINDDILVIAGDNLFEFSLKNFLTYHKTKNASIIALFDIKDKQKAAKKYGIAELDSTDKVIDFQEKPENPKTALAATACYLFKKHSITLVSDYLQRGGKKENPGDFVKWLAQREPVYGFVFSERWFDIGSFEALEDAYNAYGGSQ